MSNCKNSPVVTVKGELVNTALDDSALLPAEKVTDGFVLNMLVNAVKLLPFLTSNSQVPPDPAMSELITALVIENVNCAL